MVQKYINARFPSLCLASDDAFWSYFYSKNGHNSVESDRTGNNITHVLKTIYKKVLLKFQVNAGFPIGFCQYGGACDYRLGALKN